MRERRKTFRVEWNSLAKIYDCDGRFARACIVSNFSNGGAKITGIEVDDVADEFMLCASRRTAACTGAASCGVRTTASGPPLPTAPIEPAKLRLPAAENA